MYISEVYKGAPEEARGDLENRTYEELNKLPKQISEVKESFRFLDDEQQ